MAIGPRPGVAAQLHAAVKSRRQRQRDGIDEDGLIRAPAPGRYSRLPQTGRFAKAGGR
jgi:hypothetical protein